MIDCLQTQPIPIFEQIRQLDVSFGSLQKIMDIM